MLGPLYCLLGPLLCRIHSSWVMLNTTDRDKVPWISRQDQISGKRLLCRCKPTGVSEVMFLELEMEDLLAR